VTRATTDEPISNPGVPKRLKSEPGVQSQPLYLSRRQLPTARIPTKVRLVHALPWVLVALPAVYQLVLLATAIAGRVGYPYDLEWMEGGMLHHALRIKNGEGIYVPPSIDFIPYLYTPLYPSLLALFGGGFGGLSQATNAVTTATARAAPGARVTARPRPGRPRTPADRRATAT